MKGKRDCLYATGEKERKRKPSNPEKACSASAFERERRYHLPCLRVRRGERKSVFLKQWASLKRGLPFLLGKPISVEGKRIFSCKKEEKGGPFTGPRRNRGRRPERRKKGEEDGNLGQSTEGEEKSSVTAPILRKRKKRRHFPGLERRGRKEGKKKSVFLLPPPPPPPKKKHPPPTKKKKNPPPPTPPKKKQKKPATKEKPPPQHPPPRKKKPPQGKEEKHLFFDLKGGREERRVIPPPSLRRGRKGKNQNRKPSPLPFKGALLLKGRGKGGRANAFIPINTGPACPYTGRGGKALQSQKEEREGGGR